MNEDLIDRLIRTADLETEVRDGAHWVQENQTSLISLVRGLTTEFQTGRPVEDMIRLLRHPSTASLACFILYDLEGKAYPLLSEVGRLLSSSDWSTRGAAVRLILGLADEADGEMMALALERIADSHPAVRWYCADMICRLSSAKKAAMARAIERGTFPDALRELAPTLLDQETTKTELALRMTAADANTKLALMAIAVQSGLASEEIEELDELAGDEEVTKLARHHLELRKIRASGAS